ncbi:OLC1v1021487C1 [Oldenlandia corymbosa var. corymbosa]|uniref:Protein phosphatase n=1 Tax=Oldenlandia corymbosa var. corymbosa TaxID=529605 RepID=A0AAV1BVR8_OLDCO|nr:OLC1v1021487C1 [Oldenlandia corymbosa var. corymbosa]
MGYDFCYNRSCLRMMAGAYYLPKTALGEDAHFICDEQQTIGVADGVGGWSRYGIDSGVYARKLMDNAVESIQQQPKGKVNPGKVLADAFFNNEAEGGSTACIITLKNNALHAVNLGDSGFLLIRDGEIVYRSPIQQRYFNCPFQLSNSKNGDAPDSARRIVVGVEPGDILVAATDGLFDNIFPDDIADVMNLLSLEEELPPELAARKLAESARQQSLSKQIVSPFTEAAVMAGLDSDVYRGGKFDDVTVIVAYIY